MAGGCDHAVGISPVRPHHRGATVSPLAVGQIGRRKFGVRQGAFLFALAGLIAAVEATGHLSAPARHDFGAVDDLQPVVFRCRLQNDGTVPVKVMRVQTGCGCTVARLTKTHLDPGETTTLAVTFDPAGFDGPTHKVVAVTTDAEERPTTVIRLFARVRPVLRVTPRRLDLTAGEPPRLTIANLGDRPFTAVRLSDAEGYAETLGTVESKRSVTALVPASARGSLTVRGVVDGRAFTRTVPLLDAPHARNPERIDGTATAATELPGFSRPYVPGQVLVRFWPSRRRLRAVVRADEMAVIARSTACRAARLVQADANLARLDLGEDDTVPAAVARLRRDPSVAHVQPNFIYEPRETVPDDPHFDLQWALRNLGQTVDDRAGTAGADIQAPDAWDIFRGASSGTGHIIAILDNGVDYHHPDLAEAMWDGADCLDEHGVYRGGCVHGYDYTGNGDPDPMPSGDHGSHVAGTAAAIADNAVGVAGIAANVRIMAVRSASYTSEELVKAIYFARYNGATVINGSWGWGDGNCSSLVDKGKVSDPELGDPALYQAVRDFPGIVVFAAGNAARNHDGITWFDTADFGHTTPCWEGLPNVISVTSSNSNDGLLHDFGVNVDIAAPGEKIYSTERSPLYGFKTGTSMAAPHVAAAAALVWGFRPELTPREVRERLLRYGECIPHGGHRLYTSGNGYCESTHAKRLNLYRPLASLADPAVIGLTAYRSAARETAIPEGGETDAQSPFWEWTAPTGQGIVAAYHVAIDDDAFTARLAADRRHFDAATEGLVLTGGTHRFTVIAENDVGVLGTAISHAFTVATTLPILSFGAAPSNVTEGDPLSVPVILTRRQDQAPASVAYAAESAVGGVIGEGILTWGEGEEGTRTISIPNVDDALDEYPESIAISLHSAVSALVDPPTSISVIVTDNDPAPGLEVSDAVVAESGTATFRISLTAVSGRTVTFDYQTISGSAVEGNDFLRMAGNAAVLAGAAERVLAVEVVADSEQEGDETFTLELSNAVNVDAARSDLSGTGTIVDNDIRLPLRQGWNLLSTPVLSSEPSVAAVFGGSAGASGLVWDPSAQRYRDTTRFEPLDGIWIRTDTARPIHAEGEPARPDAMALRRGWNLVGWWKRLEVQALGNAPRAVWGWGRRGYRRVDSLEPGQGYWIYVDADTEIPLP